MLLTELSINSHSSFLLHPTMKTLQRYTRTQFLERFKDRYHLVKKHNSLLFSLAKNRCNKEKRKQNEWNWYEIKMKYIIILRKWRPRTPITLKMQFTLTHHEYTVHVIVIYGWWRKLRAFMIHATDCCVLAHTHKFPCIAFIRSQ